MRYLLAIPVFAATLSAQMYPAIWKLAHPDAKALIGVDVRGLRESQAVKSYGSEVEKSGMGMFLTPAMDVLKDIDEVFVSSPGAAPGSKKDNPPFLAVLTGHFTPAHVQKLFGTPYGVHGTFDLYGSKESSIALLDEHTIVLGDEKSVRGGINRMGQHPNTSNELLARAAAMAASHEFWLIATVPPSAFQPANVSLSPLASEIEGLDAGLSMREGLQFELSLSTKTPEAAKLMAGMLTTQLKLAAAGSDVPEANEVLQKLEVTQEGARIGVKIALDREEMDRMVRTIQASQGNVSAAKPQVDNTPKTIKIVGLDEGVREIPLGGAPNN